MRRLVIFDLDEVLVKKGSYNALGNRLAFAVNTVFDGNATANMFPHSGMTDTSIMVEMARRMGVSKASALKRMRTLYKIEIQYSRKHIGEHDATLYRGVKPLLRKLRKEGYIVCLATGNLEPVARLKLRKLGINRYFAFGGFGTAMKRAGLIREAIRQAEKRYGRFNRDNIFYFGDSPLDVRGGREARVNMIAVATGHYTTKDLAKERPDYLLKDLADTRKVMKILEG